MTLENYELLKEKKAYDALWIELLNASGFAGVLPNGELVDRRYYTESIPVQKNNMFGVVEPKKEKDSRVVSELGLQELGFKRMPQQNKNLTFEDYPHYYRLREGYQDEVEIKNLNSTGCFVFSWGRMSCVKLDTLQDVIELVKKLNRR